MIDLINEHKESYNEKIKELSKITPVDFVTGAQESIDRFREFKSDIDQDMDRIEE